MQILSFQQNTGFKTGTLIKRNQPIVADHDTIRSAVRAWSASEGQDVVSAHIIDEWRKQGGEEIDFPDDISRARQKLFRYLDNPAESERYREYVRLLTRRSWPFFRWNTVTVFFPKTILCPVWLVWKKKPAKRRLPLLWGHHAIRS